MKHFTLILIICAKSSTLLAQTQIGVDLASTTPTTSSPGFVFSWPQYTTQNMLYNGYYINLYGLGFHGFNDGTSIGGVNAYMSSYFGLDFFTGAERRFRINANGSAIIDQSLGIGGMPATKLDVGNFQNGNMSNQVVLRLRNTIAQNSSNGWGSAIEFFNLSNNVVTSTLSGAKIISEASDYGWAHNLKFRVVSNNSYSTQTSIDAVTIANNGNVGIGTTSPASSLDVQGKIASGKRQNGTSGDFEALSVFNTTGANLPSGNATVIQFYNNAANYNDAVGASIKSVSANNQYGWESDLYLRTTRNNSYSTQTILDALVIKGGSGNVGIGTNNPTQKLTVSGTVYSREVKVDINAGADYVFENNYSLLSLDSIKTYIDQHKHLPEVPSAKEMETNGVNLGEMNMLLLKKMEEMTLYIINQQREIEELKSKIK